MNLFSRRSDVGAVQYNSLLRTLLSLLLVAALPVFIWAVMTQRIELRKRAATSEPPVVCWNRVGGQAGGYYWPDGCKGNPDTTRACTMATVPLDATETYNYLQWVNAGKPYIPGCMGTPTLTPSPSAFRVNWSSPSAYVKASDFTIITANKQYKYIPVAGTLQETPITATINGDMTLLSRRWVESGDTITTTFQFRAITTNLTYPPNGKEWELSEVEVDINGSNVRFSDDLARQRIRGQYGYGWGTNNFLITTNSGALFRATLNLPNANMAAFMNYVTPTPTWTPSPTCIPLPSCVYNPTYSNGLPVYCSPPPPPAGGSYCPRPTYTPTPSPVATCVNNGSTCQTTICRGTDVKMCSVITGLCKNNICTPPPAGCTYQMVRCIQAPCEPILNCTSPTPYTCDALAQSQQFYFKQCATQGFSGTCMNKNTGGFQGCSNLGFNNDCTVNNTNAAQNILCPVALNPSALNCTREPEFSLTPATTSSGVVGGSILWDYVLRNTNDPGCAPASYSFYMEQFPQVANIGHLESPDYFTLSSGSVQYGSFKVSSQAPTQQNAYEIGKIYKFLVRPVRAQRNSNGSTSYLQHFAPFTREFVFNNSSSVSPTPPISCLNARDGAPCTTNSCETVVCNESGVCLTRRSVGITCSYSPGVCQSGRCVASITPSPTCMPRPACMDPLPGQPVCMPKMLPGSWFCPQTPTPSTYCKTGVNSFAVGDNCSGTDTYKSATYACYDGFSSKIVMAACQTSVSLANLAQQACAGHSACTTPSIVTGKIGDLNNDNKVNLYDFNILLNNFGKTGKPGFAPADLNKDGSVNLLDFNLLLKYFE